MILHVGRQVAMKGTVYVIHAFARLAQQIPGVELVIIGDGPLRKRMQSLAQSLGLAKQIRFLGALPHQQVMTWMRKAAMLVLPSVRTRTGRNEGLGMVLLEAAATGVPMIGSRQGGIPEAIIDGETGLLVSERNYEELAAAMSALLNDSAMRLRMGQQARTLVERRFDIRRQTKKLERYYEHALSDRAD